MTRHFARPFLGVLLVGSGILAAAPVPAGAEAAWVWNLPTHLPPPHVPDDNPMSEVKFELGRRLFFDTRLSGNQTVSCASCHHPEQAFTDGRKVSVGDTGELTPRNAPSIANVAWRATLTWANPALVSPEQQMAVPLFGSEPVEMGLNDDNRGAVVARFEADTDLRQRFGDAFPGDAHPVNLGNIIRAIAVFERGIVSASSRYDLYVEGKATLTPEELRGKNLFFGERAECHHCHGSVNFDDQFYHAGTRNVELTFHNTGLYNIDRRGGYPAPNRGVYESTSVPSDMGRFRAPSLRNVAVTAPYMHDGSVATLEDVIDIYAKGGRHITSGPNAGDGRSNPFKSALITPIRLSARDRHDLVAFLNSLTDENLLVSQRYAKPADGK